MAGRIIKDKNKPKTWHVLVEAGRDPSNNRRKRIKRTVHSSKEADRLFAQLQMEVEKGTYIDPSTMTVAEYLRWWLNNSAKITLRPRTFESYQMICEKHLIPELGAMKIQKLHQTHVQQYIAKTLNSGRILKKKNKDDGKRSVSLSPRTVQYHHRVLSAALAYAVQSKVLNYNVARDVRAPKPDKPEIDTLNAEQRDHLISMAVNHKDYLIIFTAAHTGMRRGEVMGLKWQDIDFENRIAMIQRDLQYRKGFIWGPPKGGTGRPVPLTKELAEILKEHRKGQMRPLKEKDRDKGKGNAKDENNNLVFADKSGGPLKPDDLSNRFLRLAKRAGFHGFTFHGLRHTWATLALASGMDPKYVQAILGHASISITYDIYSHATTGKMVEEMDRLTLSLAKKNGARKKKKGAHMVPN